MFKITHKKMKLFIFIYLSECLLTSKVLELYLYTIDYSLLIFINEQTNVIKKASKNKFPAQNMLLVAFFLPFTDKSINENLPEKNCINCENCKNGLSVRAGRMQHNAKCLKENHFINQTCFT